MAQSGLPQPGTVVPGAAVIPHRDTAPEKVPVAPTDDPAPIAPAAGEPIAAIKRIEDHLERIDGRLRLLEDRFDDMFVQLRTLGSDVEEAVQRQAQGATKEWIAWAVVTMLVVILGALWWALKIYILPTHHQLM